MIDPSSSEEESEEDQSTHHGGGGGGRGGSGSSHGSHHHPAGGPGSGIVSGSAGSGITASPGGSNHVGPAGGIATHGSVFRLNTLRLLYGMDIFDHSYYSLNKRVLWIIGQWPYQNPNIRLLSLCLVTPVIISFMVPLILRAFTSKGSIASITEAIAIVTLLTTMLIKYYMCYFGINKIKELLDRIREEWKMRKSEREIQIMEKYAEEGRLYTLGYIIYLYSTCALSFTVPFIPKIMDYFVPLNESRPLQQIAEGEYFVDREEYFYFISIHICLVLTVGVTGLVATDAMFLVFTSHVCGVFAAVGYRLEHLLEEDSSEKISSNRQYKTCTQTVVYVVNAHRRAMEFANLMESFFSLPLLLVSGLNIICMSASLFQIATLMGKSSDVLKYIMFLFAQFFHMLVTSYPGQRIIDHSSDICFKAYSGLWYEAPLKVRKMLLIVIRRSLKPCNLTAGKMLVFCLETFATVVQTSMSYFMVLSSMQ